jgi:hypothetical protein
MFQPHFAGVLEYRLAIPVQVLRESHPAREAFSMMNDVTLKQIAAVKAIVSKGSHVWI